MKECVFLSIEALDCFLLGTIEMFFDSSRYDIYLVTLRASSTSIATAFSSSS